MTESTVLTNINKSTGIATLTLNRPQVQNALDEQLITDLIGALNELDTDETIRAVMLTAAGRVFSTGSDLERIHTMVQRSREENLEDTRRLAKLMATLNRLSKPTIAKVHGAAFGNGVGLIACCDIAIASDTASFCFSEVSIGLIPATVSPYIIKAIGEHQARRYFLTAERISVQEALHIGLVHEVVPNEALDATVDKLLETLAGNAPHAMRSAKELILEVDSRPLDEAMIEETARRIAEIRIGEECREGITALLENRRPTWIGG